MEIDDVRLEIEILSKFRAFNRLRAGQPIKTEIFPSQSSAFCGFETVFISGISFVPFSCTATGPATVPPLGNKFCCPVKSLITEFQAVRRCAIILNNQPLAQKALTLAAIYVVETIFYGLFVVVFTSTPSVHLGAQFQ